MEEQVQSLERQLRLCRDDFKAEEREKKRAQAHIIDLQQELRIVHRQLDQFQGKQMQEIAIRRQQALQYYREEYERTHPDGTAAFTGRGGLIEADEGDGCDEVD